MPRPHRSSSPARGVAAVAQAADVSAMTVSRVFHNSPRVRPETRDRVLTAARAIGYRPDPHATRLMEIVRSHRSDRVKTMLAVIGDTHPEHTRAEPIFNYVGLDDIRLRAERYGYDVEEFKLGPGGVGPERMGKILHARGIAGVLVSVRSTRPPGARLDYSGLAAATFGYGLSAPQLHRASTNMTQGILETAAQLDARGYRRIGMVITPWIDARADHTYSGALLHYQQTVPAGRRLPLLLLSDDLSKPGKASFVAWMRRHRPDAVISLHTPVAAWLLTGLGLRIPEDIGLVVHDWVDEPSMAAFAGIDHRRPHVAAAAVDLVVTQLRNNELGVPEVPRQILVPPRFVDGPSIRRPV